MRTTAMLLVVIIALHATAGVSAWSLHQGFANLSDQHVNNMGGLWAKARYAARVVNAADRGNLSAINANQSSVTTVNGTSMYTAITPQYDLIMAFTGTSANGSNTAANVAAQSSGGGGGSSNGTSEVTFANDFLAGIQYPTAPYDTFTSLVRNGINLTWSNPRKPVNVLCTGKGAAASMVPLCGIWAAMRYPQAHILVEAFNSTWPKANGKFNWTLSQIVEQSYVWADDTDKIGKGKLSEYKDLNEALDKANDKLSLSNADKVAADLRVAIDTATAIRIFMPNGTEATAQNMPAPPVNATGSELAAQLQGENYDAVQLNQTVETWFDVENECPLVLCKTRFPGFLSGMIYWEYDPANPDVIGPVPLDAFMSQRGAKYIRVKGEYDADGAIFYNETTDTAYFVFRGSESDQDWIQNAQFGLRDFNITQAEERIYDTDEEPEVAKGFQEQFQAITAAKGNNSVNLEYHMLQFTQGRIPKLIVCTGQSLGGALSTLCAAYMARKYPTATVLTTNEGAPKVGNEEFVRYLYQNQGRIYRLVNGIDQVPLLPPFDSHWQTMMGMWINDGEILMQDRPKEAATLLNSNWKDHNYYLYSILQDSIDNVTVPAWVTTTL